MALKNPIPYRPTDAQREWLEQEAKKTGLSFSVLIRMAVNDRIEKDKKSTKSK